MNLSVPSDYNLDTAGAGWQISGDGGFTTGSGDVYPTDGFGMAGLSTGTSFGGAAEQDKTSSLVSGPIPVPFGEQYLFIDYNFISQEFDAWVGSKYDDNVTISILGPLGSHTGVVTSVNKTDSTPVNFPLLSGGEQTGWQTYQADISELGSPLIISVTITDVGDKVYTWLYCLIILFCSSSRCGMRFKGREVQPRERNQRGGRLVHETGTAPE